MKQTSRKKLLMSALIVICICMLALALTACDAGGGRDKDPDNSNNNASTLTIGKSGYYEGAMSVDELLVYAKNMFYPINVEEDFSCGFGAYFNNTAEYGPLWSIIIGIDEDEAEMYVTESNEAAQKLYENLMEDPSDADSNYVSNRVIGNRIIQETKQDLIKDNLVGDLYDESKISEDIVDYIKTSFDEAMKNLSVIKNSADEDNYIIISYECYDDGYSYACYIPTSSVGNCDIEYVLCPYDPDDNTINDEKKSIGTKYTQESYVEEVENYVMMRLETIPGFIFEDILDDNGDPIGEVALVEHYYNNENDRNVIIPSVDPNGKPVTYIGADTFLNGIFDDKIKSVTIPSSVKTIGQYAFYGCDGLTEIDIPASVTNIGFEAFASCESLVRINYLGDLKGWCELGENGALEDNRASAIKLYVQQNGTEVEVKGNITIPEGTTKISNYAFLGLNLTSIIIPDSVESLGDEAFYYCQNLRTIYIGKGLTSIESYAFNYCPSLQSISVDSDNTAYQSQDGILYDKAGVSIICVPIDIQGDVIILDGCKYMASFIGCASLQSITIPNSVIFIPNDAFLSCANLHTIYYCGASDDLHLYEFVYDHIVDNVYYFSEQPDYSGKWWHWNEQHRPEIWQAE